MPRRPQARRAPAAPKPAAPRNTIVALSVGGNPTRAIINMISRQTQQGRNAPGVESMSLNTLVGLFLKGKLNLNPMGQRGSVYSRTFVQDLILSLMNGICPPSILVNVALGSDTFDVHDGKQRSSAIIDVFIGMRSVLILDSDGNTVEAFMVEPESDRGYLALLKSPNTPDVVKNYITESLQHMAADKFDVDESSVFDVSEISVLSGATLIVQRLTGWTSRDAALLALVQTSGSIQQTVEELFFMTPNAVTHAVRQFENRAVEMILAMCRNTLHNNNKQIFMAVLAGAACTLDVEFVPKTSSDEGKGQFFKALLQYIEEPTPDDFNRNLEVVCMERLPVMLQLVSTPEVMGTPLGKKPWKIDMVCVLIFLLMKDVSYLRVLSILNMLVLPGKSVDGKPWFDKHWRGKKDMKKALDELFAVLSVAEEESDEEEEEDEDEDEDVEISEDEEEGAVNAKALRAACRSQAHPSRL